MSDVTPSERPGLLTQLGNDYNLIVQHIRGNPTHKGTKDDGRTKSSCRRYFVIWSSACVGPWRPKTFPRLPIYARLRVQYELWGNTSSDGFWPKHWDRPEDRNWIFLQSFRLFSDHHSSKNSPNDPPRTYYGTPRFPCTLTKGSWTKPAEVTLSTDPSKL